MQENATAAPKDEVFTTRTLYKTTNYGQFKPLTGNRPIDEPHVKELVRKMKKNGNQMDKFPAKVNSEREVIDGQHRILAAQTINSPVIYEVIDDANLDTVIVGNTGNRNWNWVNFAESWAGRGNIHYQQFLELYKKYHYGFSVLISYCTLTVIGGGTAGGRRGAVATAFREGEFEMHNYDLTKKLLEQYFQLSDYAGVDNREFAFAAMKFMRTPYYNHDKMLEKIQAYGDRLSQCYFVNDFMLALEEIRRA